MMKNKYVLIGIILMVIGASLALGGYHEITTEPKSTSVLYISGNEYTSNKFNFSKNDILIIVASNSTSGLISCKNFSIVSQSNLNNYAAKPEGNIDGEPYYTGLNGSYIFVEFHENATMYYNFMPLSQYNDIEYSSYIAAGGIGLLGAGFIMLFVSVMFSKLKRR